MDENISQPVPQPIPQPSVPMFTRTVRPWQGTVLGVVDIISLVIIGAFTLMAIGVFVVFDGPLLGSVTENNSAILGVIGVIGAFLLIPLAAMIILGIFITIGIFKGQRWTIILSLIFGVLAILGSLGQISKSSGALGSLAVNGFILYLEIVCLKHPFYNKNMQTPMPTNV